MLPQAHSPRLSFKNLYANKNEFYFLMKSLLQKKSLYLKVIANFYTERNYFTKTIQTENTVPCSQENPR